ncbi:alpha-(1,3)-fucosyltransferase B [Drosophila obscura]|uniref:alpha-(1,3)-fucosyltransferase B n=1 Tax=Drosophila obscura TaxID=7282 RepID=UPI001BB26226|nr:alpha-(1,3)-fucosyltransferase B [Drosophila obscura]
MRLARLWVMGFTWLILAFWLLLFFCWDIFEQWDTVKSSDPIEVLWWPQFSFQYEELRLCGAYECYFTTNRLRLPRVRAVLFYGTTLTTADYPLPRSPHQVWALLHEESPKNVPYMAFDEFLQHFNYTSTFSRYSDLPLTTQWLPSAHDLTSMDYVMSFDFKSSNVNGPSPSVVFLQSDCNTMSGREDYVQELMRHINVDSFGSCLRNKDLPQRLQNDYLNNLYSPEMLRFLANYKFMIAIENAVCEDYITEKFWRPLVIGVIPIYFGSPSIKDWQPQNKSAIFVDDFPNAAALGQYLMALSENKTEYNSYRGHKLNRSHPIQNKRLIRDLLTRPTDMTDISAGRSVTRVFECAVCKYLNTYRPNGIKRANVRHYNCPLRPIHVPLEGRKRPKYADDWRSTNEVGQCQATILDSYLRSNVAYSEADFDAEFNRRLNHNLCAAVPTLTQT